MEESKLSRRTFLATSALGITAAVGGPLIFRDELEAQNRFGIKGSPLGAGNTMPGKIRICTDPRIASSYNTTIDVSLCQNAFDRCMEALVPGKTPEKVLEYLMPSLTTSTKIAIKINLIGQCDSRWEVVRALVYRLSRCLNGTYDISNVTIFDNYNPYNHSYTDANFTFNGKTAKIMGNNGGSSGVFPIPGYPSKYELGQNIVGATYVFSVPVIKDHSQYAITGSLKNFFGSLTPPSICSSNSPYTNILYLDANTHIKAKTVLILADMVRGIWNNGPGGPAQKWNTFQNGTPDTLMVSTDPVTNDYWFRYYINEERKARGYTEKHDNYINEASNAPWELGVSDPSKMDVQHIDPVGFEDERQSSYIPENIRMLPNRPNPFIHQTEIRFVLKESCNVRMRIIDMNGRIILETSRYFTSGPCGFLWKANGVAPGLYTVDIKQGAISLIKTITKL
jgi:hypothetical protein